MSGRSPSAGERPATLRSKSLSPTPAEMERWMRAAIREARRGVGRTSPNPPVGAIIIKNGRILAKGWHRAAGLPHAEVEAICALEQPEAAQGADLYVTLEPCSTHGRTPPCTERIISNRFARVIVGAADPNPAHAGRGLELLRQAGIEVVAGICREECERLIAPFSKWILTRRPWVIAKAAMTLDGSLTLPKADGRWLSSPAALKEAHRLRAECDAIVIGANTLRADDPSLTIRSGRAERCPWRIILAGPRSLLPKDARVFTDRWKDRTRVLRGLDPGQVLDQAGELGALSLLIEGGGVTHAAFFDAGLVDEAAFFLTPWISGGGVPATGGKSGFALLSKMGRWRFEIEQPRYKRLGEDLLCRGRVRRVADEQRGRD